MIVGPDPESIPEQAEILERELEEMSWQIIEGIVEILEEDNEK